MLYSKSTGGFYQPAINTSIPADAVEVTDADYAVLLVAQGQGQQIIGRADGYPIAVVPTLTATQMQKGVIAEVQKRLDDFARTRGYDGILSACTYASSTVAKFQAEGQYCVGARDAIWSACYAGLAAVQSGQQPMPTSVDAALTQLKLPVLSWPQ